MENFNKINVANGQPMIFYKGKKNWMLFLEFLKTNGMWVMTRETQGIEILVYKCTANSLPPGSHRLFYQHPHDGAYDTRQWQADAWKAGQSPIEISEEFDAKFTEFCSKFKIYETSKAFIAAPFDVKKEEVTRWWSNQCKLTDNNPRDLIYNQNY